MSPRYPKRHQKATPQTRISRAARAPRIHGAGNAERTMLAEEPGIGARTRDMEGQYMEIGRPDQGTVLGGGGGAPSPQKREHQANLRGPVGRLGRKPDGIIELEEDGVGHPPLQAGPKLPLVRRSTLASLESNTQAPGVR